MELSTKSDSDSCARNCVLVRVSFLTTKYSRNVHFYTNYFKTLIPQFLRHALSLPQSVSTISRFSNPNFLIRNTFLENSLIVFTFQSTRESSS